MKRNKTVRSMVLVLCIVMIFTSVFVGCGKAPTSDTSASSTEKSTAVAASTAAESNISEPGVFPIVKDKVTLKFLSTQLVCIEDYNTNEFTKFMEEKTNVKVEWETIPSDNVAEKVNLVLASGDYPDVFCGVGISASQIAQYGVQEAVFLPLEKYIDQYGVETKKVFEEVQGSREEMTQLDGHIYAMPDINECYHCTMPKKMWINNAWLNALGLKAPTTTEEYYQVLKAFKEKDPNKNGKKDEIALAGAHKSGWNDCIDEYLLNSFVYYDYDLSAENPRHPSLYLDNGKVVSSFASAELKEGLKYINKLYKDGLIYEGTFTQDSEQLTQLVENPKAELVGSVTGGYGGMFSKVGGERYKNYAGLAPLKGPSGIQYAATFPYDGVVTGKYVVSKACKYPEVAVKWADYCYTFDGTMRLTRGRPDVEWRAPKEGENGIDGKTALYVPLVPWTDTEPQNASIVQQGPNKRTSQVRLGEFMASNIDMLSAEGLEKLLYDVTKNQYEPYIQKDKALPNIKFTKEENDELATIKMELNKYLKESLTKFMIGQLSVDKDWDSFQSTLQKLQLPKVIEMYQAEYSKQFKK